MTGFGIARSVGTIASTKRALPPGVLRSTCAGVVVDQVVDDRLGGPDLLAPAVGRLADDLVGILAVGQADDPDLVELDAGVGGRELADERLERLSPRTSRPSRRPRRRRRRARSSSRSG